MFKIEIPVSGLVNLRPFEFPFLCGHALNEAEPGAGFCALKRWCNGAS